MSCIYVIVILLDNAAENACIYSDFAYVSAENVADNVPRSIMFSLILRHFPLNWCTLVHFFVMLDQMYLSWVYGILFSHEHIDDVKKIMNFIQGKFSEDEEILCPCGRCLNQKYIC
jgi:hypothetical protein